MSTTGVSSGTRELVPRWSIGSTRVYLGAFICLGVSSTLLGPSLSRFRVRTGATKGEIGVLFTFGAVGYLVGSIAAGRLLDRIAAHRVISAGCVLVGASLVSSAFAPSLIALGLAQIVLGAGNSMIDVCGNTLVLWLHRGGPVMSALHLFFAIGSVVAPLVVAAADRSTGDVRVAYLGVAATFVGLAVVVGRRRSPDHPHGNDRVPFDRTKTKLLVVLVLAFFAYVGAEVGFLGWIKEYAIAKGYDPNGRATVLNTMFLAAFMVGRLVSVRLSARVDPVPILTGSVGLCVVGLGTMLAIGGQWWALVIGTALFGVGTAPMFASMLSLGEPYLPSTGIVTSSLLAGSSAGALIVPFVIGQQLDAHGPSAMPWAVLAGTIVCASFIALFARFSVRHNGAVMSN